MGRPKVNTVLNPLSFFICCSKQLGKQASGFLQAGFAEGNRFCFADRIGNEAFYIRQSRARGGGGVPGPFNFKKREIINY